MELIILYDDVIFRIQDLPHCFYIKWNADGSKVYYAPGNDYYRPHTMYRSNADSSGDETTAGNLPERTDFLFSPDGDTIALLTGIFHRPYDGDLYTEKRLVNVFVMEWMTPLYLDPLGDWIGYPNTDEHVNFWAWGDFISGPLNPLLGGVADKNVDPDSVDLGHDGRNAGTWEYWHDFTELQPEHPENEFLRDEVKSLIVQTLIN